MTPIKIAILGGGPAALATAFELTSEANWRERYQIDLYQMGWRLGGKCASSRNRGARGRNEEHGLHVLGGFYHNTFRQLRPLYEEWMRVSPDTAIAFEDAFVGHDRFTLMQSETQGWRTVSVGVPRDDRPPDEDPGPVTVEEMLRRLMAWISGTLTDVAEGRPPALWLRGVQAAHAPEARGLFARFAAEARTLGADLATAPQPAHAHPLLDRLHRHAVDIQSALSGLFPPSYPGPDWIGIFELFVALVRGFAADKLAARGFDSINGLDALEWLKSHGASARALACPLVTSSYHYAFAYENGDQARPNIAAGVGLRGLLRMVFDYHGSVFMHMQGGMGEIFAAPYYEVLKRRGVRFHFFHRVEALIPGDDGRLAEIRMRVQARPRNGSDGYDPLFDYHPGGGARPRRSWPETPLYEQLLDADQVRAAGDLDQWTSATGVGEVETLTVDADFDLCVLAMSVGALRVTTSALSDADPAWRAMLDHAGVAPTLAAQIWRRDAVASFGGLNGDGLLTGYRPPLDTWGDMSFLLALEQAGPDGERPRSLSYFCGPITASTPGDLPGRPDRETQAWLDRYVAYPFPGLADADGRYRLAGELERYVRINDDPLDLYVISPKGSIANRLRTDESGLYNVMLAGDWTRNNFDCGSVETAVASGRQCARAISGLPAVIPGESDFA